MNIAFGLMGIGKLWKRGKFYVRNQSSLKDALRGVDFVFQAAALKQVPS
jgi:hypothetical protein